MNVIVVFLLAAFCSRIGASPVKDDRCYAGDKPLSNKGFKKPGDCNNFYQCSNGYLHIMPCAANLAFNSAKGECDYPENVAGCGGGDEAEEQREDEACYVDGKPITRGPRAIPGECKSFQECSNGNESVKFCPDGLYFNPTALVCDWPRNVPDCNKPKPQHTLVICEHQRATISCPENETVQIVDAFYGRDDGNTCPGKFYTTECTSEASASSIPNQCNNHKSCDLLASNSVYGDPCVGTYKYIRVLYTCVTS